MQNISSKYIKKYLTDNYRNIKIDILKSSPNIHSKIKSMKQKDYR